MDRHGSHSQRVPYARKEGRKSLFSKVKDSVKDMLSPSWLSDLVSNVKKDAIPDTPESGPQDRNMSPMGTTQGIPQPNFQQHAGSLPFPNQGIPLGNGQPRMMDFPSRSPAMPTTFQQPVIPPPPVAVFTSSQLPLARLTEKSDSVLANEDSVSQRSDASKSTSGCSSMIPQSDARRRDGGVEKRKASEPEVFSGNSSPSSPTDQPSKRQRLQVSINSNRTWTRGMDDSFSKPQAAASLNRPSFNTSLFGSPLADDSTMASTSFHDSSFYPGKTTYGGRSSMSFRSRRNKVDLNQSLPARLSIPVKAFMKAKPKVNASKEAVTSSTAKRILDALDKMPTPLNDAKKIPMAVPRHWTESPTFFSRDRTMSRPGPPTQKLNISSLASISQNRQVSAPLVRRPSQSMDTGQSDQMKVVAGPSREDTMILGGPLEAASSGKMKRGKSYHKGSAAISNRQALEEEDTEILPNLTTDFTLPVSAMPRFNFATPAVGQPASSPGVSSSPEKQPALNFTFSSPIPENVPANKHESPEKRGGFQFSSPISVDKQPAVRAPTQSQQEAQTPVSTGPKFGSSVPSGSQEQRSLAAAGFSFGAPLNTSSNNMQMAFSSAPKPKARLNGPATEGGSLQAAPELKSGSVMDVLGGSTSAFGGVAPASELKQGSVMDILGGSTTKSSSLGSGFGSFQAPSSSSQSSPFSSSKTPTAGNQPSVTSSGSGALPPLSSMFDGAGWSCDMCLVKNKADTDKCVACQTPKPGPAKSNTSPAPPPLSHMFKQSGWTCDACLLTNTSDASKCVACQSARPGGSQATTQKPPPLVAVKSAGSWTCDVCLVNNKTDVDKCVACQSAKPGSSVSKPSSEGFQNDLKSKFKPGAGQWECEVCLVRNESDKSSCVACQTARPAKSFKHPAGDWTCDTCLVVNKESSVKCVACSYTRPGPPRTQTVPSCVKTFTQSQSGISPSDSSKASNIVVGSAGGFTLLSGDKKEPDTGGFKFGSGPSSKKTSESSQSSSAAGGFQFGGISSSSSSTSGSGFKFGAVSSDTKSTTATGGFTFGSSASSNKKQTSEVKSVETSKAPAAGGFNFSVPASTAPSNSISSGDSDTSVVSSSNALPGGFSFGQATGSKPADPLKATTSVPGGFSFKPSDSSIVSSVKQSEASSQLTSPAAAPSVGGFTFGAVSSAPSSAVSTVVSSLVTPSAVTQNSVAGFTFTATKVTQSSATTVPSQSSESKPAFGAGGFSFGSTSTSQSAAPAFGGGFSFAQKPTDSTPSSTVSLKRDREEDSSATEAKKSLFTFGASTSATNNSATPFQFTATNTTSIASTTTSAGSSAGFAFGKANSMPAFNFNAGKTDPAPTPVFGAANTTSQFGTGTPAFGGTSSSFTAQTTNVAAPATTTPAQPSLFVFGAQSSQQPSTATTPAFGAFNAGSTPAFGTGIAPAFGGNTASTTPAFGATPPAFGSTNTTTAAPAFGGNGSLHVPCLSAVVVYCAVSSNTTSAVPCVSKLSSNFPSSTFNYQSFSRTTDRTGGNLSTVKRESILIKNAELLKYIHARITSPTPESQSRDKATDGKDSNRFGQNESQLQSVESHNNKHEGADKIDRDKATDRKDSGRFGQIESQLQLVESHKNKPEDADKVDADEAWDEDENDSTSIVPEVESSISFFHGISLSNSFVSDQPSQKSVHEQQSNRKREESDESNENLFFANSVQPTTIKNGTMKAVANESLDADKNIEIETNEALSKETMVEKGNTAIENITKNADSNNTIVDAGEVCYSEKEFASTKIPLSSKCCQAKSNVAAGKSEITLEADKSRWINEAYKSWLDKKDEASLSEFKKDSVRQKNKEEKSTSVKEADKYGPVFTEDKAILLYVEDQPTLTYEADTSRQEQKCISVNKEDTSRFENETERSSLVSVQDKARLVFKEDISESVYKKETSKLACKEVEVQTVCFQSTQTTDTHLDDTEKTTKPQSQMLLEWLPMLAGRNGFALVKTQENHDRLLGLGTSVDEGKLFMDKTRTESTLFDIVSHAGRIAQDVHRSWHNNGTGIMTPYLPPNNTSSGILPGKEFSPGIFCVAEQNISTPIMNKFSSIFVPPFTAQTHTMSPSSISHTGRPAPVSLTWSHQTANTQPGLGQTLMRSSIWDVSQNLTTPSCSVSQNHGYNTPMSCLPSLHSGFGTNTIASYVAPMSKPGFNTATHSVNTSWSSNATVAWNSSKTSSTAALSWNPSCITSSSAVFSWKTPSITSSNTTSLWTAPNLTSSSALPMLGCKTTWTNEATVSAPFTSPTGESSKTASCSSPIALGPSQLSPPFKWKIGNIPTFTVGVSPSASKIVVSSSQSRPPLSSTPKFQFGSPVSGSTQFQAPTSSMFSWSKSESKSTSFQPFIPSGREKVNLKRQSSYGSQSTRPVADAGMDISMDSFSGQTDHTLGSSNNHNVKDSGLFVFGATPLVSASTINNFSVGQKQNHQRPTFGKSSAFSGSKSPTRFPMKSRLSRSCAYNQQSSTVFQCSNTGQNVDRFYEHFSPANPSLFVFGGNAKTSTVSVPTFSFGKSTTGTGSVVSNNNQDVVITGTGFVFGSNTRYKPVGNAFGQTNMGDSAISTGPSLSPTGLTSLARNQTATSPFRFSSPLGLQSEPVAGPSSQNVEDIVMGEFEDTVMSADRKAADQFKYVFSSPITKTKSGQSLLVETNEMVSAFSSTCVNRESPGSSNTDVTCPKSVLFGGVKDFSIMEWELSDHDLQGTSKNREKSVKFALSDIDVKNPPKSDVASCTPKIERRLAQDSDSASTSSGGFYLDYTPASWLTEAGLGAKPEKKIFPTAHKPSKSSPSLAIAVMKNNALKLMNEESKKVDTAATDQAIQPPALQQSTLNTDPAIIQPLTSPDLFVFTAKAKSSSASSLGLALPPSCTSSASWSSVTAKTDCKLSAFSGRGGNVSESPSDSSTHDSTSSSSTTTPQTSDTENNSDHDSCSSSGDTSESEEEFEEDFEERKLEEEGKPADAGLPSSSDFLLNLPTSSDFVSDLPFCSSFFSSTPERTPRRSPFSKKYRRSRGANKSWNAVPSDRSCEQYGKIKTTCRPLSSSSHIANMTSSHQEILVIQNICGRRQYILSNAFSMWSFGWSNIVQTTYKVISCSSYSRFEMTTARQESLSIKENRNKIEGNRSWNALPKPGTSAQNNPQTTYESLSVNKSIGSTDLSTCSNDLCVEDRMYREDLLQPTRPADNDVEDVEMANPAADNIASFVCFPAACMSAFSVTSSHYPTGGFSFTKPETNNNSTVPGAAAPTNAMFQFGASKPNEVGSQPTAGFNFNATPTNLNTQSTSFNFAAGSAPGTMAFSAQPSDTPTGQKRQIKKAVRKIRR